MSQQNKDKMKIERIRQEQGEIYVLIRTTAYTRMTRAHVHITVIKN